jgi:cytochrome c556
MRRTFFARAMLTTAVALAGVALAADTAPGNGPGWTGITNPKDVIAARQELMEHIELLMEPIDTMTIKDGYDTEQLHTYAEVIGAALLALPHLFPPTTNLYDPKAREPATLALPPIWKDFDTFYKLAAAASKAADALAETEGKQPLRTASLKLRASCDACHVLFLRKYEPPKVLDSDRNFDFDSAFGKKR